MQNCCPRYTLADNSIQMTWCLHKGMLVNNLIGEHLAGSDSKSGTVQLILQDFLRAAPSFSHTEPHKHGSDL